MNEKVITALRAIAHDEKLLEKFKGIGNEQIVYLLNEFKNFGANQNQNISLEDLVGLFDDYHHDKITHEEIFGADMCSQGTDGTCGLTDRPCAGTKN